MSVTYCECVSAALFMQHALRIAPYCHLWPAPLCSILPHFLINDTKFEKKLLNVKICFDILSTFVWYISNSKNNWESCDQKCILILIQSTSYFCKICMKFEFSGQIIGKMLKYQISWNSVRWEPSSMRTDRHNEGISLFFAILRTCLKMIMQNWNFVCFVRGCADLAVVLRK
jgi:hypothetical protein